MAIRLINVKLLYYCHHIASDFSLIITNTQQFLYTTFFINENDLGNGHGARIKADLVLSKKIDSILFKACKIKYIEELEMMVEVLNFCCKKDKNNNIHIYHQNENYSKAYRVGYVKEDLSMSNSSIELMQNEKPMTIKEFFDKLTLDGFIQTVGNGNEERILVVMPVEEMKLICSIDELFFEEE